MDPMGRRHFLAAIGTTMLGLSGAAVAGCGTTSDDDAAPSTTSADGAGTLLAGVSMEVRSDPG